MTFNDYVAAHVLKRVLSSDLPAAALKALEEGHESTSLGALAGLSADNTSPSEIEELWFRGLKEINQKLPNRREAALILRNGWASMVASGSIPPMVGARKMVHLATDLESEMPSREYAGDGLDLEKVLGLYYSTDDVPIDDSAALKEIEDEIREECARICGRA